MKIHFKKMMALFTGFLLLIGFLPNLSTPVKAAEEYNFQKVVDLKNYSQFQVTDDAIYAYKGSTLKKLTSNGKDIEWEVTLESGEYNGPIYIHNDGSVYVGTTGDNLVSYDDNGNVIKNYKVPGTGDFGSVRVGSKGEVYVVRAVDKSGYTLAYLYAFRPNGTFIWKSDWHNYYYDNLDENSILTVGTNNLLLKDNNYYYINWINLSDGKKDNNANGSFQILDQEGSNFYTTYDKKIYNYQIDKSEMNWSIENLSWNVNYLTENSDDSILYVSSNKGPFYALDPNDQSIKWKFDEGSPVWGKAVIDNEGNILVPQRNDEVNLNYLYKFSPSGEQLDVIELPAAASTINKREDGSLYYISESTLYSTNVPVSADPVKSMSVDSSTIEVPVKQSKALKVMAAFGSGKTQDVTSSATWTSSNSSIATVTGGTVKGVKEGTATITATYKGKSVTTSVKVIPQEPEVANLVIDPSSVSIYTGDEKSLKVVENLSNGTSKDVTSDVAWTASNDVISITKGTITALKEGTSVITATYRNKTVTVNVSVTNRPIQYAEAFKQTYNFSDLVSNTALFNSVLNEYTPDELKVIVPEKYLKKIKSTHTPNILTNLDIEVGKDVRSVSVTANSETKDAKRIKTNTYNIAWAGLKKGTELIIIAKDAKGNQLEKKILRLKEGTSVIEQDTGNVQSGNYSLLYLISNSTFFNQVLDKFSLTELTIGVPMKYIDNVLITSSVFSTKFEINTSGTLAKITLVTADGTEYTAQSEGNGLYIRDISGLQSGDSVTIRVYDENNRVIQEKPAFID